MNSFTLTGIGNLARDPELISKGETTWARFCLIGNDFAGVDEEGSAREVATSIWFTAFGSLGKTIANHCRGGDQLIVQCRVRANNWTSGEGEARYDLSFVVEGFRFGKPGRATREALAEERTPATSGL